mmetsp:Transcript_4/g.10  ORF Transcript_4/g.10 Transcript_4/m.10 type:complete len:192 (-) Transcript_4:1294-1869(-)
MRTKSLVLVLGGGADRERRCIASAWAKLNEGATSGRSFVPLWLSGPALTEDVKETAFQAGCDVDYLLVDYEAIDTLSNFTTLVDLMKKHKFKVVHISTSTLHMRRAKAIAEIVLPASRLELGETIEVAPSPGEHHESDLVRWRDIARSYLWTWTGLDPSAIFIWLFHPERMEHRNRRIHCFTYHGQYCFGN